ncbi:Plasma membrane sulfite pump involved in sulfite metabolism [Tulasnella sp. JGI-2019a]|nr:Plasma membrane sulfite pump involved in sulfite metabolism [Tulasnella sp. JGI-2019a]
MATTPRPTSSNVATPVIPNKEEEDRVKGLTGRIKHFSPSWFSVTMGTGIPCTLILNLPYPEAVHRLRIPATMFLVLDTILFAAFTITIATRYIRFPEIWRLTWTHESHSLYIGTIPMSLFTLISGWIGVSQAYGWGDCTIFTLMVILFWSCVSIPTIKGACSGSKVIFAAPCLSALEETEKERSPEETFQGEESESPMRSISEAAVESEKAE